MADQIPWAPVSAEDFANRKRRIVWMCVVAVVVVTALVAWIYQRSLAPLNAKEAYDTGTRLLKSTRYAQAILAFGQAVAIQPSFADAYLLRGRSHVALTELDPAVADFTKVIELRPHDAQAYLDRAAVYIDLRQYQPALSDSDHAIAADAKLAIAHNLRGVALRGLGDPHRAIESFTRAVELSPDVDNYFQRAATYQVMDEHALAKADLDQVIALQPDGAQAYYARAQSRRALGDVDGANRDHQQGRILDGR